MRRIVSLLVLVSTALVASGCGGSDGDGGSDAKRVVVADGETATFKGPNGKLDVGITVEAKRGSIDDLKDYRLEDDEQKMTPWYVTHTFQNRGDELSQERDAWAAVVDAHDDGGLEPKEIMPLGDFEQCELVNVPDPFPAGATSSSCEIYLVKPGAELDELIVTETRFEGDSIDHVWKVG
ncbi:MAG: hypothetical protein JWL76_2028 [Thermoleophilia bacterium]|nr:hypothetical protein [Thermoleophilia bacterium]